MIFYLEVVYHGGIPDSSILFKVDGTAGIINPRNRDLETEANAHHFFDAFWESRRAQLPKITCPTCVVANLQDQGLHTRGTLEG